MDVPRGESAESEDTRMPRNVKMDLDKAIEHRMKASKLVSSTPRRRAKRSIKLFTNTFIT